MKTNYKNGELEKIDNNLEQHIKIKETVEILRK